MTSLWRVKGDMGAVLDYASDEKKTLYKKSDQKTVAETMERQSGTEGEIQIHDLHTVADYAMRGNATVWQDENGLPCRLVSGINCEPELAVEQMRETQRRFQKMGGTIAYHGYQSFSAGEGPPDVIHKIGVETARRLWGERYQVLVTTHVDHVEHLHNHFVVCAMSFVDGKKYYRSVKDYYALRRASDELARQYGFSVLEQPQVKGGVARDYTPGRLSWRKIVKADVDEAVTQARTEEHLYALLRAKGYALKTAGKDVSVRAPGAQRFLRLERNFGPKYSRQVLRRRILEGTIPPQKKLPQRLCCRGSPKKVQRHHGIQALYLRYCFLLGAIPKRRRKAMARVSPTLKADVLKMNRIAAQTQMLCRNQICSKLDLEQCMAEFSQGLDALAAQRAELRRIQRTASASQERQTQIAALTGQISRLRRELKLCDEVWHQTEAVQRKVQDEYRQPVSKCRTDHLER